VLKGNETTAYPRNMIFFDVESRLNTEGDRTYHQPYLLVGYWYYTGRASNRKPTEEWFHTSSPFEFWDWVSRKVYSKTALYMFAHNIDNLIESYCN